MSLLLLLTIPVVAAPLAWLAARVEPLWSRLLSLLALVGTALVLALAPIPEAASGATWWLEYRVSWVPSLGIDFHLGLDGLSYVLLWLTVALGAVAVVTSWREIRERTGFFHFNLLLALAGVIGVFTALDLFLFFVFWEVMLVPMSLLIAVWGHGGRRAAALKFFIFTQASSLLMLVAIAGLAVLHLDRYGSLSFAYADLLTVSRGTAAAWWLMLGFFAAFAVKLPIVPFHTWLPDAHTEAPTAGSVILAAVLLKTGAYGLLRFNLPFFPEASEQFAPVALGLGTLGVLYGAKLAFAQHDMKRLIAYSSVSHMGFVLLGIYAMNTLALQGAVVQMVAHGLSTAALFMIVGMFQERWHTRSFEQLGGLWTGLPRLAGFTLVFALASLGLPGLANFIGEFLVLAGAFQAHWPMAVVAALGLVGAALYSLLLVQRGLWGERRPTASGRDSSFRETALLALLVAAVVVLGLWPQPILDLVRPPLEAIVDAAPSGPEAAVPWIGRGERP